MDGHREGQHARSERCYTVPAGLVSDRGEAAFLDIFDKVVEGLGAARAHTLRTPLAEPKEAHEGPGLELSRIDVDFAAFRDGARDDLAELTARILNASCDLALKNDAFFGSARNRGSVLRCFLLTTA